MAHFIKEEDGIYLLKIPFEDLYTSVFALISDIGSIILDTATNADDVKAYIIPAMQEMGIDPNYIICSHMHSDHSGGMTTLLAHFPNAAAGLIDKSVNFENKTVYFHDGDILFDRFQVLNLKGHTEDSLAIFDQKNQTLLSCDCLQQCGIGKYRDGISDRSAYLKSLARVREMDMKRIIFSHDYDPCGYSVSGKEKIQKVLDICMNVK